ncbi:MAG: DegV family EDD domain-containing protein, partial [Gemmatimonadetes bacterium]|nr:DegV family EDD domain-containing protein [Gemmatimonadota bacterium]
MSDNSEVRARESEPASAQASRPRVRIAYLDGHRLRRGFLAGAAHVGRQRAELDRINVFPVPDGDTGTNLTLTLRSIAGALRHVRSDSFSEVAGVAAEAGVLAARGNSGMLFSRYLLGFSESIGRRLRVGPREIAEALTAAAASLHDVLENPREGTIITVARDLATEARRRAHSRQDVYLWLRDLQAASERSLQRTMELLPVLREAGVVDAGAKGLVSFFEGVVHYIEGHAPGDVIAEAPLERTHGGDRPSLYVAREAGFGAEEGRYCTQIAVRGESVPETAEIRRALKGMGTSTIVLRAGGTAKIHIHADTPEAVRDLVGGWGEIVSEVIEDTQLVGAGRHVAVVTDSAADLPQDWAERHGVTVVPLQVIVGDRTYRDGIDLDNQGLKEILTTPGAATPKTSQPPPSQFVERFNAALDRGAEQLLGIFVSGALSGTYGSAAAAMREFEVPTQVIDSRSGSLGVGLLVARAVELLDDGHSLDEVAAELRAVRDRSNIFLTVNTFEYLLRSGRVGRAKAWLGGLLDLKPILSFDDEGRVIKAGTARGTEALLEQVLQLLEERLSGATRYRLGVAH